MKTAPLSPPPRNAGGTGVLGGSGDDDDEDDQDDRPKNAEEDHLSACHFLGVEEIGQVFVPFLGRLSLGAWPELGGVFAEESRVGTVVCGVGGGSGGAGGDVACFPAGFDIEGREA